MGPAHLAIAFAAKPAAPKIPLGVLLLASELIDLLCFAFIALGLENGGEASMDTVQGVRILSPSTLYWSHGLFMALVWSVLFGGIVYLISRRPRMSAVTGLVVFSHWLLDFIVHPPHLPLLLNGSPKVGLGLWTTGSGLIASGILEVALLVAGIVIYLRRRGQDGQAQQAEHRHH